MKVGLWIKQYREKNNMSQEEFGREIGVNKQTISRWEKGSLEPAPDKLYEIADAINVSLSDILSTDVEEDNLPVYSDNRKFSLGINSVFKAIHDLPTLCIFVDMISEIMKLTKPNEPEGVLLLDRSIYDDASDSGITVKAYSVHSNCLNIDVITEFGETARKSIATKEVDTITPVVNFNNQVYAVDVKLKNVDILMQLLFDLGDK